MRLAETIESYDFMITYIDAVRKHWTKCTIGASINSFETLHEEQPYSSAFRLKIQRWVSYFEPCGA